jgi:hypothetical protein
VLEHGDTGNDVESISLVAGAPDVLNSERDVLKALLIWSLVDLGQALIRVTTDELETSVALDQEVGKEARARSGVQHFYRFEFRLVLEKKLVRVRLEFLELSAVEQLLVVGDCGDTLGVCSSQLQ